MSFRNVLLEAHCARVWLLSQQESVRLHPPEEGGQTWPPKQVKGSELDHCFRAIEEECEETVNIGRTSFKLLMAALKSPILT